MASAATGTGPPSGSSSESVDSSIAPSGVVSHLKGIGVTYMKKKATLSYTVTIEVYG